MPKEGATGGHNDGKAEGIPSNRDTPDEEQSPPEDEKPNIWMGCGLPATMSALLLVSPVLLLAS
jgi:hypothetical protein